MKSAALNAASGGRNWVFGSESPRQPETYCNYSRQTYGRSGEGEGGCCGPEGAAKEAAERLHRSVQLLPEVHVGLSHDPHRCESPPPKSSLSSTPGLTVSVHLSPHCHGVYTPPLLFVAPPNASRTDVPLSRSLWPIPTPLTHHAHTHTRAHTGTGSISTASQVRSSRAPLSRSPSPSTRPSSPSP